MASREELELKANQGKWEPLILVAALAVAALLGYAMFSDKLIPKNDSAKIQPQELSARQSLPKSL